MSGPLATSGANRTPSQAGLAAAINAASSKSSPAIADTIPLTDSENSWSIKKTTLGKIKDLVLSGISLTWEAISGKPSVFPPATHTHASADITDATNLATANTVVKRDADGDAAFVTVEASVVRATNNLGQEVAATDTGIEYRHTATSTVTTVLFGNGVGIHTPTVLPLSGNFALTGRSDGVPDAITPADASTTLTNLGGGATGKAVFVAATPAAGRAALNIVTLDYAAYTALTPKDSSTIYIVTAPA